MKMITLLMIFFLMLSGCTEEETGPTSFEGQVVYADDGSPFTNGVLNIASRRSGTAPSCCYIEERDIEIKENGEFDAEFSKNDEIDYFNIIILTPTESIFAVSGLDCSPYDCDNFKPGKAYKDLVIRVPR